MGQRFIEGYVITKPLHASQTLYKGEKERQFQETYPSLEGGAFFSVDCIRNYELIRLLCSFGKNLIVLKSDSNIENEIYQQACDIKKVYDKLRT